MEYGKNTINEFAQYLIDNIIAGDSESNVVQMISDWQKPLVHYKDSTEGLWCTDKPDLVKDEKNIMFRLEF